MPLRSRLGILCLLLGAMTGGCTSMYSSNEPFSYEQMRRQVDGIDRDQIASTVKPVRARRESTSLAEDEGIVPRLFGNPWQRIRGNRPEVARQHYAAADGFYRQALAAEGEERKQLFLWAADRFEDAAKAWPESSLEQDALFLAGESYFFAEEFPDSNRQFEKLLKRHPNTRYLDVVEARRFSIAQYWLQYAEVAGNSFLAVNITDKTRPLRDTNGNALRIFDRIRIDDPTGRLADDATMAAANAYFRKAEFVRADEFYSDLRKHFPSSEHQFMAHYLGAQAKLQAYEGSEYSGVPLDEAAELITQIRRQFPADYEKYHEEVDRMHREIRFHQAEREWFTARYYEGRKAYAASRFHYNIVLNDYSDTVFAEKARERVAAIAGFPDHPDQKLQWLVEAFPESRGQKPLIATGQRVPETRR